MKIARSISPRCADPRGGQPDAPTLVQAARHLSYHPNYLSTLIPFGPKGERVVREVPVNEEDKATMLDLLRKGEIVGIVNFSDELFVTGTPGRLEEAKARRTSSSSASCARGAKTIRSSTCTSSSWTSRVLRDAGDD